MQMLPTMKPLAMYLAILFCASGKAWRARVDIIDAINYGYQVRDWNKSEIFPTLSKSSVSQEYQSSSVSLITNC